MYVNNVSIEHQVWDDARKTHTASVVLEFDDCRLSSFLCSAPVGKEAGKNLLDATLLEDAARQARRMPELRSNPDELVFLSVPTPPREPEQRAVPYLRVIA